MQIEKKIKKLQLVQYVIHDKIARDSFIMKFLWFFFHFVHKIFFTQYNCSLNNVDYH